MTQLKTNKTKKYRNIDIALGIVALFGLALEILNDVKNLDYENIGQYIGLAALVLWIINQYFKTKEQQ